MGKPLILYALPATIRHDPTRRICMGWDYERTLDEARAELYAHLHPEQEPNWANLREYEAHRAEVEAEYWRNQPYVADPADWREVPNPAWCPWCAAFAPGGGRLDGSPLVKAERLSTDQSHWFLPRRDHTDLVNRFSPERKYRQVLGADVEAMRARLTAPPPPPLQPPRDALEALTRQLEQLHRAYCGQVDRDAPENLAFCEKWLAKPDTIVVVREP